MFLGQGTAASRHHHNQRSWLSILVSGPTGPFSNAQHFFLVTQNILAACCQGKSDVCT